MWRMIIQLHKKGSSSTTVQSYQPTQYELELQKISADYANSIKDNALKLNDSGANLYFDSLADTKVDYNKLLNEAQGQIGAAQQGVAGLTQGILPEEYQKNMENSIKAGVQSSVGSMVNDLGGRGVLNSSVMNTQLQGINDAAANAMAEQYNNNIGTLNGLYGQQSALAGQNITTAAGAQEAATNPGKAAWEMSMGLNGSTLGALSAMGGQGTTTSTQKQSGGSGLLGGVLTGLAGNSGLFCFTEDTKIKTPDGERKISELNIGDKVISYSILDDCDRYETVTEVMKPHYSDVYTVVCECKQGKKRYVNTTLSQPLLTEDGYFIVVGEMPIGTKLKGAGKVISVIYSGERKVYDLKVSGSNTYYADGFIAKGGSDEW